MYSGNFSTIPVEPTGISFANSTRAALVVLSCILSTLGNFCVIFIFIQSVRTSNERGYRKYRVVDVITISLAITGLFRGFIAGIVQAVCLSEGRWVFGAALCQVQAYMEAMWRHVFAWYLSLLSIERYTKYLVPHEYLVTFSVLTINVILPAIMLVVIVQVTAPIYGWGEYAYLPEYGMCGIAMETNFGCSYAVYITISLDFPPVLIMMATWTGLLLQQKRQPVNERDVAKRDFPAGNSRILENETFTLSSMIAAFVVLAIPRQIMNITAMCDYVHEIPSALFFCIYYLEGLTCCLLPGFCLCLSHRARTLLLSFLHVPVLETVHGGSK